MNILVKILTFILTSGIVGAVSIFLFGLMILLMNGYNEKDAEYGIILYMIWAFIGSLLAGLSSILTIHFLVTKKQMHIGLAGLISVIIFLIGGIIINTIGILAGIATAEIVRTQF